MGVAAGSSPKDSKALRLQKFCAAGRRAARMWNTHGEFLVPVHSRGYSSGRAKGRVPACPSRSFQVSGRREGEIVFAVTAVTLWLAVCPAMDAGSASSRGTKNADGFLLSVMDQELQRAREKLGKLDPPAYYLSYSVHDQIRTIAVASQG